MIRTYAFYLTPESKLTVEQARQLLDDHNLAREVKPGGNAKALTEAGLVYMQTSPVEPYLHARRAYHEEAGKIEEEFLSMRKYAEDRGLTVEIHTTKGPKP